MLAWGALISGFVMWPLGILFGHVSNRVAKREHRRRSMLAVVGLVLSYLGLSIVSIGVIAAVAGSGSSGQLTVQPVTSISSPAVVQATVIDPSGMACVTLDSAGYCLGDDPTVTSVDTPTISESRQQALDSARSYLDDGQGFSRLGLIDQLHSQYGEKFSLPDATWAVNNSGADWKAQAVISAQGYMSDGQGFSRAELIDQLTSSYGEQFTYAQATYAANKVGL